jgi:hypothetical protein
MEEQEEQSIDQQEIVQPEKKRRGRPARIIQSGVTIIDTPQTVEAKEQGTVFTTAGKAFKRGRKPKEVEEKGKKFNDYKNELKISESLKLIKKKKCGRKKIVRRKKAINIWDVIKPSIKMPKIKINLSGIKLPKGLTWGQVGAWTIAAGSLIVAAVK